MEVTSLWISDPIFCTNGLAEQSSNKLEAVARRKFRPVEGTTIRRAEWIEYSEEAEKGIGERNCRQLKKYRAR